MLWENVVFVVVCDERHALQEAKKKFIIENCSVCKLPMCVPIEDNIQQKHEERH